MYLQAIPQAGLTKKKNTTFTAREILEGGGSNKKTGSLKIRMQKNNGEDLFMYNGVINDEDPKGFRGNKHFNKLIAKAADIEGKLNGDIKKYQKQIAENNLTPEAKKEIEEKIVENQQKLAIWKTLPESEKSITKMSLLLPGTIHGHNASFLPNIINTEGESLTDINLGGIFTEIKKAGKIKLANSFNQRTDFVPLKDLGATGVEMAYNIVHDPELSKRATKGLFAVVVHSGGGFGSADIMFKHDGKIGIKTNEDGHNLYYDPIRKKEVRLGKMGSSVGCVIENYASGFGITDPEDIKALMDTGNAQMATTPKISLKTVNDEKAINALLKTNAYEVVGKNSVKTTLQLKGNAVERFDKGLQLAVDSCANALCRHAMAKINQGANLYVVSGPLNMGLSDTIIKKPHLFGGAKDMRELVFRKIDEINDSTCNRLRKDQAFDIICNHKMSIKDNTFGGSIILSGKTSFERRGEWVEVSKKVLKSVERSAKRLA